jgi:hypothetical protein
VIVRGPDRRYRKRDPARLAPDRRDGFDRRALAVPAIPGTVRPGFAEAPPRVERRRVPESGME